MSLEERERRSRSRTARAEGHDPLNNRGPTSPPTSQSLKPSVSSLQKSIPPNQSSDIHTHLEPSSEKSGSKNTLNNTFSIAVAHMDSAPNGIIGDRSDTRSSSLSELGDGPEENDLEITTDLVASSVADDDSEAETERLESTPRNVHRTNTISTSALEKMPSKQSEFTGRKRKRGTPGSTSHDESETGQPASKRGNLTKPNLLNEDRPPSEENIKDQVDNDKKSMVVSQREDAPEESVEDQSTSTQNIKSERGRKRSSKANGLTEKDGSVSVEITVVDETPEGEGDEEDASSQDEDLTKKRIAIESLSKIERKFRIFREKMCEESISQLSRELEMLQRPDCAHPEYIAMLQPVNERRDEKIDYESRILTYRENALQVRVVAERHQLHSQYFQTVRDVRASFLAECNQRYFQLQRERRHMGPDEPDYTLSFQTQRSTQIHHQAAYNAEVSILSGFSKHVGFPAAPDITSARSSDIDDDLRAMKISSQPVLHAPAHTDSPYAERVPVEQFYGQSVWANLNLLSQQGSCSCTQNFELQTPTNSPFVTSAGQRGTIDTYTIDGSAIIADGVLHYVSAIVGPVQESILSTVSSK